MKREKVLSLVLAFAFLVSGCNRGKAETTEQTVLSGVAGQTATSDVTETSVTETTASEPFEFNPHVYSGKIAERVPQDYWDSFYNLCDALRKGEDTFQCSSQEAYNWATDVGVLCDLFPPAGAKIEGKSTDGSPAFENGTGKIRYKMPVEDFLKRESDFEVLITDILNSTIEKDDTEYERALKLYLYVAKNYVYDTSLIDKMGDDENFVYACFMEKRGQCVNFASVYAYLLLQADGVDGIYLDYFMMSDKNRIADGCKLTDPDVTLLPECNVNKTNVKFDATDDHYCIRDYCRFVSLDEEKKIVHYVTMYDEQKEFYYGDI